MDGVNQQLLTLAGQGIDYVTDFFQRSILFADILRKRGNNYLSHLQAGQPPVLVFDYEVIMDGNTLERPVNYSLVRIIDRRESAPGDKTNTIEKRTEPRHTKQTGPDPYTRPIVIIDPRAGHGPGIAGIKLNSQIGIALNAGHPVYFMLFLTHPVPEQTVSDVQKAHIRFIEEVSRRHPKAGKPAIIGNCQAGWAAALIGADRPDITGPLIFNGSPLSYWGGVIGAHPMRYRGGLSGGVWLASFGSDLGNGMFDGAHLVAGFESLNPANTYWSKYYHLFDHVDTEEDRFLEFEKWWGGFFLLSSREIHFIVSNLFISDELAQGFLSLQKGSYINLKNFKGPIVIFASMGDNITPPQQALNWIPTVYKTLDEIKRCGQVIVYLLHETIGHLGIFVSTKVIKKEHQQIIKSMEVIEYLSPGLYEMIIKKGPSREWMNDHEVEFHERDMEDIIDIRKGKGQEEAFYSVSAISKFNDKIYRDLFSPWVRLLCRGCPPEFLRQLHPLRIQRYMLSDLNPFLLPLPILKEMVEKHRRPVDGTNVFYQAQTMFSEWMEFCLAGYQGIRDTLQEQLFYMIYGNAWIKTLFYDPAKETQRQQVEEPVEKSPFFKEIEDNLWNDAMRKGGFEEAVIRIVIAVIRSNRKFDMREFKAAEKCMLAEPRLKIIKPRRIKQIIKEQSAIIEKDPHLAIRSLVHLLPDKEDRIKAFEIASHIARADLMFFDEETSFLERIHELLFEAGDMER